ATLASTTLSHAGLISERCATIDELTHEVAAGAGAALIAEEAVREPGAWTLVEMLRRQPPWSDFPLLILTTETQTQDGASVLALLEQFGNVTLLERPIHAVTLLSSAHSALRARRRQYEVRDHLS